MIHLLTHLLEWDINLELVEFRSETSTQRYRSTFLKLLPHVIQLIKIVRNATTNKSSDSSSSLLMIAGAGNSRDNAASSKQSKRAARPLIKLICYMFVCVPFQIMFRDYCLPEFLALVSNSISSSKSNVQVKFIN